MSAENYDAWLDGIRSPGAAPRQDSEYARTFPPAPFSILLFHYYPGTAFYEAEVVEKGTDLIFHFFGPDRVKALPDDFEDKLGSAFLSIFPHEEKISSAYTAELGSWAVRVRGYGQNPSREDLVRGVFLRLDSLLK